MNIWSWLHILAAYLAYIVIALLASILIRRSAGDLKDMRNRNSPQVLILGAAANLIAMLAVLLLLVFWDHQSIAILGLSLSTRDVLAALSGVIATFVLAVAFLAVLRRTHRISALETRRPSASSADIAPMVLGLLVLASVVLQEETLNRGYVSYNLLPLGRVGILVISTVTFVLIHFLTNRANLAQVISWTISGLTLALAYLLSGSIWVPIILHYATDAANVLIFNITGRYSFFITTPALTEGQRAVFRVTYGLAITAILFAFYGLNFKIG